MGVTPTNVVSPTRRVLKAAALPALLSISAYSTALALTSPERFWAGWVALVPLFICIRVLTPPKALLGGAFWGIALYTCMVVTPGVGLAPSFGSLALSIGVPAGYTYLGARLTRQVGFSPYLLALGWMVVEFGLWPLGLQNGLLVGTQRPVVLVNWVGHFAGCVMLAFLVAYVTAWAVEGVVRLRVVIKRARFVIGPLDAARRFFSQESFNILLGIICPARPRAPPLRAH